MKRIIFMVLTVALALLFVTGCAVNEKTGLIRFQNAATKDVTFKIGDVSVFVAKGAVYDYWLVADLKGEVSSKDCEALGKGAATFKVGYCYNITASTTLGKTFIGVGYGYQSGVDTSDAKVHNPFDN
ncbi:MAG TPA: hypothetical protein PK385_13065 [Spirochaetota bacterium]|jgi:hypothetical protein|nr:MAG: hypothetical protein BWX91_02528 [Spirochaetes bacterium ADurb.Bin133]HNZ28196.1 hypothetical protein [Spirochaetota bacterium]HOF02288.1 hypothetical protein [Spirochaetota bacterium]HOS34113.1 hypothetical protein [Spirochaetota bacterium]HOS56966.1 hypothetical protein [Spirochaetota bacterium]